MKKKIAVKKASKKNHNVTTPELTIDELAAVMGGEVGAVSQAAQSGVSFGGTWIGAVYGGDYANWAYNE
ncbi:MAG: hypothetical protein IPG50_38850 [Myxococcales bacterium]|nr:hypothetical protein [Myxococcales bacterium]